MATGRAGRVIFIGIVIALHAVLAWMLLLSLHLESTVYRPGPITAVYMVPPATTHQARVSASASMPALVAVPVTMGPLPVPTLPALVVPDLTQTTSSDPVNWRAAAVAAAAKAAPALAGDAISRPNNGAPPAVFGKPTHQAGDQENLDGRRIVWVSENCYQISSAADINGPGLVPRTVCPGLRSSGPRDDLFDQLPAYKKYSGR